MSCVWCKSEYTVIYDDFGQPVYPNHVKYCFSCGSPLTEQKFPNQERRIDALGRIAIPKEFRSGLNIDEGDLCNISLERGGFFISLLSKYID